MSEQRVLRGDCLRAMRLMEPDSFDAVVTDPPYGVDLAYGMYNDSYEAWDALMARSVPEMLRVATGPVVVFGANPPRYMQRMLALQPDRVLIWNPSFSMSQSRKSGIYFRWHPIFCWRLPARHDGPCVDVLHNPCDGRNWWVHPGTKPVSLMECLLGFANGGSILDPFVGSGTTLVAAKRLGITAVGVELDTHYCEIARKRLLAETPPCIAVQEPTPDLPLVAGNEGRSER